MSRKTPLALIGHMLDCAGWAVSYSQGMTKEDFLADRRTQQAIVMNLLIISEMASRLARDHADFCENRPEAPWREMAAMRNRIAHGYFELNLHIVWDTTLNALPELIQRLTPIRDRLAAQEESPI